MDAEVKGFSELVAAVQAIVKAVDSHTESIMRLAEASENTASAIKSLSNGMDSLSDGLSAVTGTVVEVGSRVGLSEEQIVDLVEKQRLTLEGTYKLRVKYEGLFKDTQAMTEKMFDFDDGILRLSEIVDDIINGRD